MSRRRCEGPAFAATVERRRCVAEDFQPIDDWRGIGGLSPAGRRQPAAPARLAHRRAAARRRGRGAVKGRGPYRAASRQRAEARHRPGALYRRHRRAARHPACRAGAEPRRQRPPARSSTCRRRPRRPASSPCLPPATSRATTTSPAPARTSRCSPRTRSSSPASRWPWSWRDSLDAARAAAERAVIDIEPSEAILDIADGAGQTGLCAGAVDHPARRSRRGAEVGAAQAERRVQRRRAGALLSRRPDRLRPAGRGRRPHRAFLDPASDRGAACLRPSCWAATSTA